MQQLGSHPQNLWVLSWPCEPGSADLIDCWNGFLKAHHSPRFASFVMFPWQVVYAINRQLMYDVITPSKYMGLGTKCGRWWWHCFLLHLITTWRVLFPINLLLLAPISSSGSYFWILILKDPAPSSSRHIKPETNFADWAYGGRSCTTRRKGKRGLGLTNLSASIGWMWHSSWKDLEQLSQQNSFPPPRHTSHSFEFCG